MVVDDDNDDNNNNNGMGLITTPYTLRTDNDDNGGSDDNHNNIGSSSLHKRTLDYIRKDSMECRRHTPLDRHRPASEEEEVCSFPSTRNYFRDCVEAIAARFRKTGSANNECLIASCFPCWTWLQKYDWRGMFPTDLIAGITVGVMIIPQSMSYARLAGLPVQYGLYSGVVPIYVYAVFGSSRQLAVGPVALVSLLLNSGLSKILEEQGLSTDSDDYQERYTAYAIQCSFLVGLTYIIMGLLRMGFVTIFLSHAVVSGFTSGAAVIIAMSQIMYIVGYDIERSDRFQDLTWSLLKGIRQFDSSIFAMGMVSCLLLLGCKRVGATYTKMGWMKACGPLILTTVSVLLTVSFDLSSKGIPVVGEIPRGLPGFTMTQWFPISNFVQIYEVSLSIVVVGFMESIAIAKQLAAKHKYEIDSSAELVGLGMANFCGSAFNAYPVTGSFSRSAVNNETGAQSGISGFVTATLVCVALLLLTPVFEVLPLNALAAIVLSGVVGLLDFDEMIHLWRIDLLDWAVWMVACTGTMFAGVEIGLCLAVTVSLFGVVYQSAYPHVANLGRLPGSRTYGDMQQYPEAEAYDGLVIFRMDAPLYFANAQDFIAHLDKCRLGSTSSPYDEEEEKEEANNRQVRFVIIDMSPITTIDSTALGLLEEVLDSFRASGQELCFCSPVRHVWERMHASGFVEKVGLIFFFASIHDAVEFCLLEMDAEAASASPTSLPTESTGENQHGSEGHHPLSSVRRRNA